ncbi:MAG: S41 family peptidase, partial [Pseudomonadota bacterium]
PLNVKIIRDVIRVQSVRWRAEETVGYVRITTFNEKTMPGLERAMKALHEELGEDMTGVVLDLRNNPGGLLEQAVSVSDAFLDRGEVVSTRGRNARDAQRFNASRGDLAKGLPVIVLINANSASASEIVAGALQDHRRGLILGESSFGKGTVQTIIQVGPDAAMRLTTARYYTPSGRSIQELGIEPDIEVAQMRVSEDGKQRKPRRERDLKGHFANEEGPVDPESQETAPVTEEAISAAAPQGEVRDYQLDYALNLMRSIALYQQRVVMN